MSEPRVPVPADAPMPVKCRHGYRVGDDPSVEACIARLGPAVDYRDELTALADAFYRVVEYLRAPTPPITESEAAEIADAALSRAEEVLDRGR